MRAFFFSHALSPLRPLRGMCLSRISSTRERVWGSICRNSVQRGYLLLCSRRATSLGPLALFNCLFHMPEDRRQSYSVLLLTALAGTSIGTSDCGESSLARRQNWGKEPILPQPLIAQCRLLLSFTHPGKPEPKALRLGAGFRLTGLRYHFLYKHFSLKAQEHAQPLVLPC